MRRLSSSITSNFNESLLSKCASQPEILKNAPKTPIVVVQGHRCWSGLAGFTHVVLTLVKTLVKTGLGKTPKTHMRWVKMGKTNVLNSKYITVQTRRTV